METLLKRIMETPNNVESNATSGEEKAAKAEADQQELLLSGVKDKVNGEPKEPSPPKRFHQEELVDDVPAQSQDKSCEHLLYLCIVRWILISLFKDCFTLVKPNCYWPTHYNYLASSPGSLGRGKRAW